MRHELLARALSELDDDLLEEAYQPFPKKKRAFTGILRYAAAAACFVVIIAATLLPLRNNGDPAVSINGTNMLAGESTTHPVEIRLTKAVQQRTTVQTEIPLHISTNGETITLSSDMGGTLLDSDEKECRELVLTEDTDIRWLVNSMVQNSFELTLHWNDRTVRISATVDPVENVIVITAGHN